MALHTWLAFWIASLLIALSPGSGAVLSMSHGLTYGVKKTSATILGLQFGLLLILFIAGAGVGSLLLASEVAFNLVKVMGALYLIFIGWQQWRAPLVPLMDSTVTRPDAPGLIAKPAGVLSARQRCLVGFLTNITNPKGIVFMVAVLPQFISPHRSLMGQLMILAITMVSSDLIVMHGYAFAASALRRWMRSVRALKIQNRLFGGLLMAVGTGLFFVKRTQAL